MKKIIFILAVFLSAMVIGIEANAQITDLKKYNYIILTNNVEQLKPIFLTADKLKTEDGKYFGEFQVIVCGKTVENLADAEKMKGILALAAEAPVKLIACGFSLNKFNVDAANIPKQFSVVENGILYNFQLQKNGYYSISL